MIWEEETGTDEGHGKTQEKIQRAEENPTEEEEKAPELEEKINRFVLQRF